MTTEEQNKKIEKLRMVTDAKLEFIKQHSHLIDEAFEDLKSVTESELDIIHQRIQEIDTILNKNRMYSGC